MTKLTKNREYESNLIIIRNETNVYKCFDLLAGKDLIFAIQAIRTKFKLSATEVFDAFIIWSNN